MTSTRVRNVAISVLLVLAVGAVVVYAKYFAPSGDLDDYARYNLPRNDGAPKDGAIKVTFLGTTTLLFDDGESQFMVDGFLTRPSFWKVVTGSPIQTDTAAVNAALSRAKVERLKALYVAHSHYDHVLDVAYIVRRTHAQLYGSFSTLNIGRGSGLSEDQLTLYEPGDESTVGDFTVTVFRSKHSPAPSADSDIGVVIDSPLHQPARASSYREGGSFDVLIEHGGHTVLVKPSANYREGALDDVRADVLFLATATLGNQSAAFQNAFYDQTVAKVHPRLVIPVHWDNAFTPLTDHLSAPYRVVDNLAGAFDFLVRRLGEDRIQFGIMQGYQAVILFADDLPAR